MRLVPSPLIQALLDEKRRTGTLDDTTIRNIFESWQPNFPQSPTPAKTPVDPEKAKVERKRKSKAAKIARKQNRKG